VPAADMLAATWDQAGFVAYSSALKSVAVKLSKISSDSILLTSGPRAGLAEINLPALQPGSSIMPGKVNPVIPEVVNIIAFRVMGNDYSVGLAAHSGNSSSTRMSRWRVWPSWSPSTCLTGAMALRTLCVSELP
jgi:aspartate ammonia-lyase